MGFFLAPLAFGVAAAVSPVTDIAAGNAETLPAQRHYTRIVATSGPVTLLAVSQDGADGHGLCFYRSDDDGATWRWYAPIQDDASERDTTDEILVGNDIALVYSYESYFTEMDGSTSHDVWFQWWRWNGTDYVAQAPVRVFDSTSSSTAYYRAELAMDSAGRLWVQAFELEPDGSHTAWVAVSTDGGTSFAALPALATGLDERGGGRLLALGSSLVMLWDTHSATPHALFRTRSDGAPLDSWTPAQTAFPDGIYHGAALSAVADGAGGMQLVYKDKDYLYLWYRRFDGTSFGPATLLEDQTEWETQPALTTIGNGYALWYNRVISTGYVDWIVLRTFDGTTWSDPTVIDSSSSFKGYPAAPATLPATLGFTNCAWGVTPTANDGGTLELYQQALSASPPPPPPPPPPPSGTLFSDGFDETLAYDSLGASWNLVQGLWYTDGANADTDMDGADQATETVAACAGCTAVIDVVTFGVPEAGVFVRAPSTSDTANRYEAVLLANGDVQLRRRSNGNATALAEAPAGFDPSSTANLSLSASGAGPVTLTVKVNGATAITFSDATPGGLAGAGYAGMWTTSAGVPFEDFALTSP